MGEIADAIINGDFDAHTGEWMGSPGRGIPRTLDGSLPWERKGRPQHNPQSQARQSVMDILKARGVHDSAKQQALVMMYGPHVGCGSNTDAICKQIRSSTKSAKAFRAWLDEKGHKLPK